MRLLRAHLALAIATLAERRGDDGRTALCNGRSDAMVTRRQRSGEARLNAIDFLLAELREGDTVLVGSVATPPHDWTVARVLWFDALEVLIETSGFSGTDRFRSLVGTDRIRAFGTAAFCSAQKQLAVEATLGTAERVEELERMVTEVRAAVDTLLTAIGQAALEASQRQDRTAMHAQDDRATDAGSP